MTERSRLSRILRPLLVVVLVLALGIGGLWWWRNRDRDSLPAGIVRGNGRIELTRSDVAAKIPGRLVALAVAEGDTVRGGQVLGEEDGADVEAQLAGASAIRERALAAVARAGGEREARVDQARLAAIDWRETDRLGAQKLVAPVELEQRKVALAAAEAGVGAASGGVAEARAALAEADAAIRRLTILRDDLHLRAPGPPSKTYRVEYRVVEPGTVLPAGGRVVSLLDPEDVTLSLFLPAATVAGLAVGDEARILPEGFAAAIPARIAFVAPDAQFTPKFVETASEREKLSYRVKLRIAPADARALAGKLKAGMTADGYVRTDSRQPWPRIAPDRP